MKIVKQSLVVVTLLLAVFAAAVTVTFWAPDISRDEMKLKYGGGESQFLDTGNGGEIHYRDQGSVDGEVLIFIHGTSASLHTWEPLIKTLSDRYRLVSLDLPGHGLTGANTNRDYSRQAMVAAIWKLLDHLDIRSATLVGNSLGGGVAWASALDSPERVNSLILLSPSGAPLKSEPTSNIGFKILKTSIGQALMKKITPRPIIEASLRQSVAVESIVSEEMIDRYWELLRLKGNRQAMIDLANTTRNRQAWRQWHKIKAPVLLIWGEEDGLLPVEMATTFERELENISLVKLKGVGHLPMEESVETVSESIVGYCGSGKC